MRAHHDKFSNIRSLSDFKSALNRIISNFRDVGNNGVVVIIQQLNSKLVEFDRFGFNVEINQAYFHTKRNSLNRVV